MISTISWTLPRDADAGAARRVSVWVHTKSEIAHADRACPRIITTSDVQLRRFPTVPAWARKCGTCTK